MQCGAEPVDKGGVGGCAPRRPGQILRLDRNLQDGARTNRFPMTLTTPVRFSLLALATALPLQAQDEERSDPPGAAEASAGAPLYTEEQLLETFGWILGRRAGLPELELSAVDIAAVVKGLQQAAHGEEPPYDLEEIGPAMETFMNEQQETFMSKLREAGRAESEAFLAELRQKPEVTMTASGLGYEIIEPGAGRKPAPSDVVTIHYTGTLVDGTVFDSSVQRGEPAEVPLDRVIPGWTEGIQQVGKGGRIRLYVPPRLAYGNDGAPGIPPASTLIFEIELLDVREGEANGSGTVDSE